MLPALEQPFGLVGILLVYYCEQKENSGVPVSARPWAKHFPQSPCVFRSAKAPVHWFTIPEKEFGGHLIAYAFLSGCKQGNAWAGLHAHCTGRFLQMSFEYIVLLYNTLL